MSSAASTTSGEPREGNVSQGGGVSLLLSGGDECSEPESLTSLTVSPRGIDANGDGAGVERGAAAPTPALPCQYNDNCIEKRKERQAALRKLSPNQKHIRHKMIMGIEWMVKKHGIERVGVLTLSFGVPGTGRGSQETRKLREQAKERGFVQKRWHSFRTNVVAKRYENWVCVFEQHRDGVWHIHVVVATQEDVRTGTDIETLSNYKLPYWMRRGKHLRNEALAAEWKALRQVACKYRFGRVELLPVKKSAAAVAFYLGDYLVKTYERLSQGQRYRLVRFSRGINQVIAPKFTIHGLGQLIYRTRLRIAARMLNFQEYEDFAEYFGKRWHYLLKNAIAWIPVPFRFVRGEFECGWAAILLEEYQRIPEKFVDEAGRKRLADVSVELWRRLEETLEEDLEKRLLLQTMRPGDNVADGSLTPDDRQEELLAHSEDPF